MTFLEELKNKSSLASLVDLMEKEETRVDNSDYWKLTVDDAGVGSAIIRFLPAPVGESLPCVKYYDHYFKNPVNNRWYVEKSRTSLGRGEKDPVSEYNSILWKQGEAGQDQARRQKRRENIVSNILVIKDNGNPDNNGKVFKYRYGKKIYQKIISARMGDEDIGEVGFNPFSPWEGANFLLKSKKVKEFLNYDDSKFLSPSIMGDDDFIVSVCSQAKSLQSYIDPASYKSYDELKARMNEVFEFNEQKEHVDKPGTTETSVKRPVEKDIDMDFDNIDMSDIDDLLKDI